MLHGFQTYATGKSEKIDIELFLIQAADYELEQNYLPNALKYLIKAKTYSKLEQVIKENIDSFIITKHEHTLFSILSDIPPTIFRNSLWMPLAYSLVTKCVSLEKTEHMLLHTLMNFEKHNNHIGVLLSCCGLISYQHFIGGDIIKCRKYFHKAGELFKAHGNELSQYKLLEIYTALAIGCIFTEEECDTKKYSGQSRISRKHFAGGQPFICTESSILRSLRTAKEHRTV